MWHLLRCIAIFILLLNLIYHSDVVLKNILINICKMWKIAFKPLSFYFIEWRCNVCISNLPHTSNSSTGNKPGLGLCRINGNRVGNSCCNCSSSVRNSGRYTGVLKKCILTKNVHTKWGFTYNFLRHKTFSVTQMFPNQNTFFIHSTQIIIFL